MNLYDQLRRQLNFILTSCRAYDAGISEEATRIAVVARVLFHDTTHSHSLISYHLGRGSIRMRSTTAYPLHTQHRHFLGFIGMAPSVGGFHPYLDNIGRDEQIPLSDWWSIEPILELPSTHETITRK